MFPFSHRQTVRRQTQCNHGKMDDFILQPHRPDNLLVLCFSHTQCHVSKFATPLQEKYL